jgi:hypothetical protein
MVSGSGARWLVSVAAGTLSVYYRASRQVAILFTDVEFLQAGRRRVQLA